LTIIELLNSSPIYISLANLFHFARRPTQQFLLFKFSPGKEMRVH